MNELIINPKYQRNKSVWNAKAESYLIDTILRGLPIPQIFLRQKIDINLRHTTREVIDGQQRLRTIIKFVNDEFPVMKSHNSEYGGNKYSELADDVKEAFLDYQIPVELIKSKEDSVIYDMFVRVNTNSFKLNSQELRNARFWGDFKVLVYKLSSQWRSFFQENNVFKPSELIRMQEAEFISNLLILIRDGITHETQTKMDSYYKKYDNELPDSRENEDTFNSLMYTYEELINNELFYSPHFIKKNYIYTLFAFYLLQNNQLQNIDFIQSVFEDIELEKIKELTQSDMINLIMLIDAHLNSDNNTVEILQKFKNHHKIRTTNEAERKERLIIFIKFVLEYKRSGELYV